MKSPRRSIVVPLAAFFAVTPLIAPVIARGATGPSQDPKSGQASSTPENQPSQPSGRSYVDYSLPALKRAVPAIEGLTPDSNGDKLPHILEAMADRIAEIVPRLPDLISQEEVYRSQGQFGPSTPQQLVILAQHGETGPVSPTTITPQGARGREFRYLILCHHTAAGITVEESRTDPKGHPVKSISGDTNPLGSGFAYQWLLFSSANQPEFRFRYLGEQEVDGRKTFVIAFAQTPDRVKVPAVFQSGGKQVPYFYQGILWVDQATFDIVFLRTDLLAPLQSLKLTGLTTELHFRSVRIHDLDSSFWLPSQVHMVIEQGKSEIVEVHEYSNYHLYRTSTTIVPEQ